MRDPRSALRKAACKNFVQCKIRDGTSRASDLPAAHVRGNVARVEGGTGKGADSVGRFALKVRLRIDHGRVIEIGPEDQLRCRQQPGRERRLTPSHQLAVAPRGPPRVAATGTL